MQENYRKRNFKHPIAGRKGESAESQARKAPKEGVIKINVDGSLDEGSMEGVIYLVFAATTLGVSSPASPNWSGIHRGAS